MSPIFVIGSPRSGTTLLRLILSSHPKLWIPPECGFAVWFAEKYGDWNVLDCDGDRIDSFSSDLQRSRKFETWRLSYESVHRQICSVRPSSYGELVACIYQLHAAQHGKPEARWGDKNNHYLNFIRELGELFPCGVFIHIMRDCRDVVCSYREVNSRKLISEYAPKLSNHVVDAARQWTIDLDLIESGLARLETWRRHEVRYEDLVQHPEATLLRVCAFLKVEFSVQMLEFHRYNQTRALEPREFLLWKERTIQPLTADSLERYRVELTSDQVEEITSLAGQQLQRHGYLAS